MNISCPKLKMVLVSPATFLTTVATLTTETQSTSKGSVVVTCKCSTYLLFNRAIFSY